MTARVLIIAGSDSGGGAGIQADLKAVTCLGAFAATAVTALTAQNTQGVYGILATPTDLIESQIAVVLNDIGADCLKTGMLASDAVIKTVVKTINAHGPSVPLVADPVMVAKGGARLLDEDATGALIKLLIPRAAVVTPNLPEAEVLTGLTIQTVDQMRQAGRAILAMGAKAALVKGGHLKGDDLTDVLMTADGEKIFTSKRIQSRNTHGTGCTLASAIAAGIAQGMTLADAVTRARDYVREAILTAPGLGKGHGPLNHGHTVKAYP